MATRRRGRRSGPSPVPEPRQTVVVCRGGDCGNRTKHPGVDHASQVRALREGLEPADVAVLTSRCLDACDHSNVVVVVPGPAGRELGAAPVWLGEVLDEDTTADLVRWVGTGGPGLAPEPVLVDLRTFRPNRMNRHELEEETGLT